MGENERRQLCERVADNIKDHNTEIQQLRIRLDGIERSRQEILDRIAEFEQEVHELMVPVGLPSISRSPGRLGRRLEDGAPILLELERSRALAEAQSRLDSERRRLEALERTAFDAERRLSELHYLRNESGQDFSSLRCGNIPGMTALTVD